MASPNTLARNASLAHLKPSRELLAFSRKGRRVPTGEYKELLALSVTRYNERKATDRAARNGERAIPTSGSGRRRAKMHRQQGLCMALTSPGVLCPEAVAYGKHCELHAPAPKASSETSSEGAAF